MTHIQQQRAAAFDRFEAQDARLRNFPSFPHLKSQEEIYEEHRQHRARGRTVIFLAMLCVSIIVFAHLVMTGPVQDQIEAALSKGTEGE